MPYQPYLDMAELQPLLARLEQLRLQLEDLDVPEALARWLAGYVEARGAHMSTRIEGNPMTEREVIDLFEAPGGPASRVERENLEYRDAARFAVQAGDDYYADIDGGLIRALHFLTVRTTFRYETAGQYRTRQNAVMVGSRRVYLPPPPHDVPRLMGEMITWLQQHRGGGHPLVLAAVAHAEFVKVHPFDDGNGRTARALSVYFLARGGWRLKGFVGVEQVFGEEIDQYRSQLSALGETHPGSGPNLTPWVRWFLERFAFEVGVDLEVASAYRRALANGVEWLRERELPERLAEAIAMLWLDGSVGSSAYAEASGVTAPTAASDLRRLVDLGMLRRVGRGRATRYQPVDPEMPLDRSALRAAFAAGASSSPPGA